MLPFTTGSIDIIVMIFVLSAISPDEYVCTRDPYGFLGFTLFSRTLRPTWNQVDCFSFETMDEVIWSNFDSRKANASVKTFIYAPMEPECISSNKVCHVNLVSIIRWLELHLLATLVVVIGSRSSTPGP